MEINLLDEKVREILKDYKIKYISGVKKEVPIKVIRMLFLDIEKLAREQKQTIIEQKLNKLMAKISFDADKQEIIKDLIKIALVLEIKIREEYILYVNLVYLDLINETERVKAFSNK